MPECHYLHCYWDDNWAQCPPNCGEVRRYKFDDGNFQWYCEDGAEQVRSDTGDKLRLAQSTGGEQS